MTEATTDARASEVPRVEGYQVERLLGEGSHAQVFAAKDARGRSVALKVLRDAREPDPRTAQRMDREAAILARIHHPGVVRLLDHGRTAAGQPFLAMERVSGGSLRQRLDEQGVMTSGDAWRLVREVADAVSAAHARGVLHRDLSSANVLIERRGRARLTDFGLAWVEDAASISRDGASIGTPAYMAPEQWWGAGLDERTDVYGLGGLLYEALSGTPPWAGEDAATLIHRVATSEPTRIEERRPELAPAVSAFVRRALARSPDDRPPDVAAFIREGDAAFGHHARRVPVLGLLVTALLLAAPFVFRYAGTFDARQWVLESGWAGYGVLASLPIGAALAHTFRGARLFAPLLPLLNGALGFETGMMAVRSAIAGAPPEEQFIVYQLGAAEASACWFLGASLSALLAAWAAVRELELRRPEPRELLAAGVALLAGALTLEPKAVAVSVVAVALILSQAPRHPQRAVSALVALVSVCLAAWLSVESDAARVWSEVLLRSDRAERLTSIRRSEIALLGASALSAGAMVAVSSWRGVRAWPRRRLTMGGAAVLVSAVAFVGPWLVMREERNALGDALSRHFAVWSELDPPSGSGDGPARVGLTVQVGRERVTVEGEPVAPLASLRSRTGALLVAQQLGARLTLGGDPELVVAIDRALAYEDLAPVLRVASELGVRRVDLLLLPDAPLRPPVSAPPEASIVLPGDLRALHVVLEPGAAEDAALRPDPSTTIDALVSQLVRGPRRLAP